MAKMFYSLEEASQKLGIDEEKLREFAATGRLQQFRDRDKVMFKREQIDDMVEEGSVGLGDLPSIESDDASDLSHEATIPLADAEAPTTSSQGTGSVDTGMIDLITGPQLEPLNLPDLDQTPTHHADATADSDDTVAAPDPQASDGAGDLSGITQIADSTVDLEGNDDLPLDELDDDELVLEQVGSGSGLLDLTRESDDTSLGTELLDEIYPSGSSLEDSAADVNEDSASTLDTMEAIDAAITSSSIFDGAGDLDISNSGLENLQDAGEPSSVAPPSMAMPSGEAAEAIAIDYGGNGLGNGMLMAATGSLFLIFIVVTYALMGVPSTTTESLSEHLVVYSVGLLALGVALGLVGLFLGRAQKR